MCVCEECVTVLCDYSGLFKDDITACSFQVFDNYSKFLGGGGGGGRLKKAKGLGVRGNRGLKTPSSNSPD